MHAESMLFFTTVFEVVSLFFKGLGVPVWSLVAIGIAVSLTIVLWKMVANRLGG